jgi:hypothetical protein
MRYSARQYPRVKPLSAANIQQRLDLRSRGRHIAERLCQRLIKPCLVYCSSAQYHLETISRALTPLFLHGEQVDVALF